MMLKRLITCAIAASVWILSVTQACADDSLQVQPIVKSRANSSADIALDISADKPVLDRFISARPDIQYAVEASEAEIGAVKWIHATLDWKLVQPNDPTRIRLTFVSRFVTGNAFLVKIADVPGFKYVFKDTGDGHDVKELTAPSATVHILSATTPKALQLGQGLKAQFETSGNLFQSNGRYTGHGTVTENLITFSTDRNTMARRMLDIEDGGTVYSSGAISGDARGDQSTTDTATLSWNYAEYYKGGNFKQLGVRARLDRDLKGWESELYVQPFLYTTPDSRALFVMEGEAGGRNFTEWTNTRTVSGIQDNAFGRIGGDLEWMPRIGFVNATLDDGLRLLFRGRGWGDTFDKSGGSTGFRWRGFFDADLTFNISANYRVFFRYEAGSLPPDLAKAVNRFYAGVGTAW